MNNIKKFLQKKQKSLLYIVAQVIIVCLLILVVMLGYSYGFLGPVGTEDIKNTVDVTASDTSELHFTKGNEISLNIGEEQFNANTGFVTSETTSTATLKKATIIESVTEKYNVYLDITDNNYVYTTAAKIPEMILSITDPTGTELTSLDGFKYVTSTDPNTGTIVKGFDITTYAGIVKIAENYSITTTSEKIDSWKVKITFVDLATNQEANKGRNLTSEFIIQSEKILKGPINELLESIHGGIDGSNNVYHVANEEYRYSGLTVENYVMFNDELWRIIGTLDETAHGLTNTNLVKIIKDEAIGKYLYDNEIDNGGFGYNSWSDDDGGAESKQLLNDYYYNSTTAPNGLAGCDSVGHMGESGSCNFSTTGISDEARSMIEEVTWYLGSVSTDELSVAGIRESEKSSEISTAPGAHSTWTGHIGLIYMSDYGYASDASNWAEKYYYISDSWLTKNYNYWSMVTYPDDAYIWHPSYTYYELGNGTHNHYLHPTVYLNTEVKVIGGVGTETNPYILEI